MSISTNGISASVAFAAQLPSRAIIVSPLSTKEIRMGVEAGLGCDFSVGKSTFFVIVVGEALVKPNGILRHFKLDNDQSLAIINYGGSIGDNELRILIDRDNQVIQSGEEATTRNARMTVRFGGGEKTVRGRWTCGA